MSVKGKTMKKIIKLFAAFSLLAGVIGVGSTQVPEVKAEAATVTTKRVWMKNSITSTWDADGAGTAIHYWGGAQGTTFPGVRVNWDDANKLVYFDLPEDITHFMFVRVSGGDSISDWGAKTEDLIYSESVGKYFDLTGPIAWDGATTPGSFVTFTPATTTIVSNFAATIDTSEKACSSLAAQAAVNAYNALSTFEQNQFNDLDVGEGVTGSERLNFLKSFYGIGTPLNVRIIPESNNKNIAAIVTLAGLSLTSVAGYYFLKNKKVV